jgi:hypothetical protein
MADLNHEDLVKAFTAASIAANDHARAQAQAQKATEDAQKAIDDYAAMNAQAAAEVEAAGKKTKKALEDLAMSLGKSAVDLGKAMITGSEGTTKYAGAVTGAADAAGNAAATMLVAFGPLGIIVGGVIKAFGALVGASLKQNDTLMKSYRELSDIGSVSGSLEKLQSDLGKVGLTTDEAEKFGKLLGKTAPDLASFGGSVSAGKDKFIGVFEGMIGVGNKTEIAMQRIGYSSDEMRDATADYVAKQSRLGLAQNKTAEQLRGESVKYMVTLRELGELTGMSRDEAQKLIDQQQADARWSMTLRQMEAEGKGAEAQKLQAYMATYEKTFGKDAASGLMEQIANKGAIVGEASAKAYTSTQGQAYEMAMKVAKDQATMQEGLSQTAVGIRKNMDQLGPSFAVAGQGLASMTGDAQQVNAAYALESKKNIDVAGNLAKAQEDGGKLLNKNIDLEQKNREMRIMADKALMEVTQVSVSVFQKLNDIVFSLGKMLARVIDGITATGLFGMEATDLSKSFRDLGDNAADMKSAAKEKASLLADIENSKKEIAAAEAASANSTQNADQMKAQMREKEQLITDMQKEARKITDISLRKEAETNIAKEKLALRELNEQARGASKDGKLDSSAIIEEKKKLLLEKQQKLAIEEEKLQKLEKEKSTLARSPGGSGGASASASSGGGGAGAPAGASSAGGGRGGQGGMTANEALGLPEAGKVLEFGSGSGSKSNFEAIDSTLKEKVVAAGAEYNEASGGKNKLQINSAKRDTADQQRLWDESVASGRPGIGPTGMIIGKPGTSKHEHGLAVDIQNYKDPAAMKALQNQGLSQPYPGKDPVHFEVPKAMEGGAFNGPNSGYPVELHGKNESVWPEEKLKATLAEVQKSSIEDYKKQLLGEMGMNSTSSSTSASSASSGDSDATNRMMEILTTKFDDMINQLETSNGTLRNLLTYAQA